MSLSTSVISLQLLRIKHYKAESQYEHILQSKPIKSNLGIRCLMRVGEQEVDRVGTPPVLERVDLPVVLTPAPAARLSKFTGAPAAFEPSSMSISDRSLSLSRTTGLAGDSRSRPLPSLGTHAWYTPRTARPYNTYQGNSAFYPLAVSKSSTSH